jgi:hypothetical protein
VIGIHLLAGVALLAILGWRVTEWNDRGWSGMVFSGPDRRGGSFYSIWPAERAGTVTWLAYRGPAERAGIRERDVVESFRVSGRRVEYTLRDKGERRLTLESPLASAIAVSELVISTVVALFFLLSGALVLSRQPGDRRAIVFWAMALIGSLAFFIQAVRSGDRATPEGMTTALHAAVRGAGITLEIFLAALLLHFALVFPRPRPAARDAATWRRTLGLIYVPPSVLTAGQAVELFFPPAPIGVQVVFGIIQFAAALLIVLAFPYAICVALGRSYRESGVDEKRQFRWPVWGTMAAIAVPFAIPIFVSIVSAAQGASPPRAVISFVEVYGDLFYLLIPAAFAIGITKYKVPATV